MSNYEKYLQNPIFQKIGKVANSRSARAFVIGGYVRDKLLGRKGNQDIDIVSDKDGIGLAIEVAQQVNPKIKVNYYKNYGTAAFRYQDTEWEFVGARKESYSENSRNPEVQQGSLEDDQKRRDFTINALALSLNEENYGALIDPFDGISDLENQIIRTPSDPDITFSDDPLRMMRAIRFATQLQFRIDEETFKGIQKNAARINIVSKERVMTEFNKIMLANTPSIGLSLLDEALLMEYIIPELTALKGVEEIEGQSHKDNFYHTLQVVDNISETTNNLWLRWAALLHDIGKARTKRFVEGTGWTFHSHEFVGSKMVKKIFKRLKLPVHKHQHYVENLVMLSSRPVPLTSENASDSAVRRLIHDAGNDIDDLFLLCKADITTKHDDLKKRIIKNYEKVEQRIQWVEAKDKIRNFQPPISGEDIMNYFELAPGPEIGWIKKAIKEAILEGEITNNREEAFQFMINKGKELHLKPKTNTGK